MPIDILIIVVVVAFIQSIFGVGILLFGTPILLLSGYEFVEALGVLLPVSLAVNTLQVLKHYRALDVVFYKQLLLFSIPFVAVFLALVTSVRLNVTPVVAILLLLVAIKSFSPYIARKLQILVNHEKLYLMTLGIVHGLSNLGGSMLTVIMYGKQYSKDKTRVTTAACYATLALCQLLTLLWVKYDYSLSYYDKMSLAQVGVVVFLLTEEAVYHTLDDEKYSKLFAAFLFVAGVLLIVKSL